MWPLAKFTHNAEAMLSDRYPEDAALFRDLKFRINRLMGFYEAATGLDPDDLDVTIRGAEQAGQA